MKNITYLFFAVCLAGCSATSLKHEAKMVRITNTEPGKECKYLGDVTGNQGNFFTGGFTSNANLETGARNDIKNKAAALGGNLVSILTQRAGETGSIYSGNGSVRQTNVTLTGNVYFCPY